jgi:hypothetical protein
VLIEFFVAEDSDQWHTLVNTVVNLQSPYKAGNSMQLTSCNMS